MPSQSLKGSQRSGEVKSSKNRAQLRSDLGITCPPKKIPSSPGHVLHLSKERKKSKVPAYEDVLGVPVYATVGRAPGAQQDDTIHYADIQVFSQPRERSVAEVKSLQLQNATEYATLNFPSTRLKYDSKNGTLV
ncbi:hypothetical protein WISP_07467 [Willisornis vidua]|uniref:Uncharacterized protein n=1 Tax=Willisornis vidua TaxID=1566151 RepID=A0ABQ9DVN8_9PASS|nr:hypothetical protein WISP_07467 [Willisornis vidua]